MFCSQKCKTLWTTLICRESFFCLKNSFPNLSRHLCSRLRLNDNLISYSQIFLKTQEYSSFRSRNQTFFVLHQCCTSIARAWLMSHLCRTCVACVSLNKLLCCLNLTCVWLLQHLYCLCFTNVSHLLFKSHSCFT